MLTLMCVSAMVRQQAYSVWTSCEGNGSGAEY